jgi:pimeloyl-ACP methyl ester carboxylesterase
MGADEPPAEGGGLTAAIVFADDGSTSLAPGAIADLIYQCCDAETQAWAAARVGRESTSSMVQSPRQVAWRTTPSTYVVCEQDRTVSPALQRVHATRCTTSVALDTDHSPFASSPDALAEVIVDLVARVG